MSQAPLFDFPECKVQAEQKSTTSENFEWSAIPGAVSEPDAELAPDDAKRHVEQKAVHAKADEAFACTRLPLAVVKLVKEYGTCLLTFMPALTIKGIIRNNAGWDYALKLNDTHIALYKNHHNTIAIFNLASCTVVHHIQLTRAIDNDISSLISCMHEPPLRLLPNNILLIEEVGGHSLVEDIYGKPIMARSTAKHAVYLPNHTIAFCFDNGSGAIKIWDINKRANLQTYTLTTEQPHYFVYKGIAALENNNLFICSTLNLTSMHEPVFIHILNTTTGHCTFVEKINAVIRKVHATDKHEIALFVEHMDLLKFLTKFKRVRYYSLEGTFLREEPWPQVKHQASSEEEMEGYNISLNSTQLCIYTHMAQALKELQALPLETTEKLKAFIAKVAAASLKDMQACLLTQEDAKFFLSLPQSIQNCLKSHYPITIF